MHRNVTSALRTAPVSDDLPMLRFPYGMNREATARGNRGLDRDRDHATPMHRLRCLWRSRHDPALQGSRPGPEQASQRQSGATGRVVSRRNQGHA